MEGLWVKLYYRDGPLGHNRLASMSLFILLGELLYSLPLSGRGRSSCPARVSHGSGTELQAPCAERQILTSANGTACSSRHELRSRAFLFIVSAECALPTNASLFFAIFARILANAPPPHESLRTCFVCAMHANSHFCPQHWLLCHLGLY